ncbi:hypothetical protein [Dethiobacter alkaliphilus]|uniref:hypothetical protein n=1 Tax=Dethiobacter alkaliphilus TaxID=427926 RepID=UPI0012937A08|nr:hypothetical protein [Dethiobacter alkaliphilus]
MEHPLIKSSNTNNAVSALATTASPLSPPVNIAYWWKSGENSIDSNTVKAG